MGESLDRLDKKKDVMTKEQLRINAKNECNCVADNVTRGYIVPFQTTRPGCGGFDQVKKVQIAY